MNQPVERSDTDERAEFDDLDNDPFGDLLHCGFVHERVECRLIIHAPVANENTPVADIDHIEDSNQCAEFLIDLPFEFIAKRPSYRRHNRHPKLLRVDANGVNQSCFQIHATPLYFIEKPNNCYAGVILILLHRSGCRVAMVSGELSEDQVIHCLKIK
jgi:hypothetical protein